MPIDCGRILLLALTGSFIVVPILLLTLMKFVKFANRSDELGLMRGHDDTSCSNLQFDSVMTSKTKNGDEQA